MTIEVQPKALPTIPVPKPDVQALCATLVAMKQVVEGMLRGSKPLGIRRRPTMAVQQAPPDGPQDGDFWLCSAEQTTLNIYVGGTWRIVGNLV
jgi:hypothetical protein